MSFSSSPLDVYPFRRPQIASLIAKMALTKVFAKYADFVDVFSLDLISKLPKHTKINNYAVELVNNQQPSYKPIYKLESIELKILKTYIETNLANRFIKLSKSPANALIFFNQNFNGSFRLCVDYRGLNNLIIKNKYPLPLVKESLDMVERVR